MVGDVGRWLLLLLPVLVAFATWLFIMFSSRDLEPFPSGASDDCEVFDIGESSGHAGLHLSSIALSLAETALGSDNLLKCMHESAYWFTAPFVMMTFLVIVLILLMNMLIAMMAKSFDIIWEQQVRMYASSFDPPCTLLRFFGTSIAPCHRC